MDPAPLTPKLEEHGAFRALVELFALRGLLADETIEHVGVVYERLERVARDAVPLASLRVAVLLHELPLPDLERKLASHELAAHADLVLGVISGFGELWKATTDEELAAFVERRRAHLPALLLFELVHEGALTVAMRRTATLGRLSHELQRWAARL